MDRADRYPVFLLFAFVIWWTALAIHPSYRQDWLLENLLIFIFVPWLALSYRRLRFSNAAYTCLFVFFALHAVGAHYTYSEVPYERWFSSATGIGLDEWSSATRNHYDRAIHFLYGLLIALPAYELIQRRAAPRGWWVFFLTWTFILSHSVIYETVEWAAATVFGGPLGTAYLGTQGDEWDAQKDMALASLGAAMTLATLMLRGSPSYKTSAFASDADKFRNWSGHG